MQIVKVIQEKLDYSISDKCLFFLDFAESSQQLQTHIVIVNNHIARVRAVHNIFRVINIIMIADQQGLTNRQAGLRQNISSFLTPFSIPRGVESFDYFHIRNRKSAINNVATRKVIQQHYQTQNTRDNI